MATTTPARPGGAAELPRQGLTYAGFIEYLIGVREELKKAIWPTRAELYQLTKVVLVIIFLVAVYCGVLDAVLTVVTDWAFSRK